jgi:hypothetical protein
MKRLGMVLFILSINANAYAWKGDVHNLIAEKAGFTGIDAACPDRSDKGKFSNHYYNAEENEKITAAFIKKQANDYDTGIQKGALYGAIWGSFNSVMAAEPIEKSCKPIEYFVHYMGDLSAPFHNILRDQWTKDNHGRNDKADLNMIDDEELSTVRLTNCSDDLLAKVAELANTSKEIGYKQYNDKVPDVSDADKKAQIIKSINLLRGVKKYCFKGQQVI